MKEVKYDGALPRNEVRSTSLLGTRFMPRVFFVRVIAHVVSSSMTTRGGLGRRRVRRIAEQLSVKRESTLTNVRGEYTWRAT